MATALIQFTQGANTDAAGKAVLGDVAQAVTVTNGSNTGVTSWKIFLLDAPSDSATFPAASQPQILAQAVNATPTVVFTPDVPGTYRVMLEVTDGGGSVDRDIRCFGIPDFIGFVNPPYQQNPEPLPVALPGIVTLDPRPTKPDEQNYGANVRGWAGNGSTGQLDDFFKRHADLPFKVIDTTPYTALVTDPPLHLVDVFTIGGPATFTLPANPRIGFVARIGVLGTRGGDPATIQASGGGFVGFGSAITLYGDEGAILIHQGSNNWAILSLSTIGGGATPISTARFVDVGTTGSSPDGTINNPFPTIQEAVDDLDATNGSIYVALGDYSAETVTIAGIEVQLFGMSNDALDDFSGPIAINSDSNLALINMATVDQVTTTALVSLVNTHVSTSIECTGLKASATERSFAIADADCASIVAENYVLGTIDVDSFIKAQYCIFQNTVTINSQTDTSSILQSEFEGVGFQFTSPLNAPLVTFDAYSYGNFTRNAWSFAGYGGGGVPVLINKTLPLKSVRYVDNSLDNDVAGFIKDGTIANPFSTLQAAIQSLGGGGTIYLYPGDYTGETLTISGSRIEIIGMVATSAASPPYLPTITTDSPLTLENIGFSTGGVTSNEVLTLNNTHLDGTINAFEVRARNSRLGETTAGTIRAVDCSVEGALTATDDPSTIVLEGCTMTGSASLTFSAVTPGFIRCDPFTFRWILHQGTVITNGSIDAYHAASRLEKVIAWDGTAPEAITVLEAGHPPGVYHITGTGVVTDAADTGTIARTVDWSAPDFGADSAVLGGVSITTTGSIFQDGGVIITSDGTVAVTVTFATSSLTGSLEANLYANAVLQGTIV